MHRFLLWFYRALGGALCGLIFYALDTWLIARIGVSAWENSLIMTGIYGIIAMLSIGAIFDIMDETENSLRILIIIFIILFSGALSSISSVGFFTGAMTSVFFAIVVLLFRKFIYKAWHPGTFSFIEVFLYSLVVTTCMGAVWILQTAPAYAEGFVLLSWFLFGIFNFTLFIAAKFLLPKTIGKKLSVPNGTRISILRSALTLSGVVLLGGISIFYFMWIEGEYPKPLEAPAEWDKAIIPLADSLYVPTSENDISFSRYNLIELLQKKAVKDMSAAQLATLSLLSDQKDLAQIFKNRLTAAAGKNQHTGPEGSIKYGQRFVMFWAMYYKEITNRWPDLFTKEENALVEQWFASVLEKIFSPGWVDYLYAIPFQSMPMGPYLNQEIGAGAVSILDEYITDNQHLKKKVHRFKNSLSSGWDKTFKNGDDAFIYQDVWMGSSLGIYLGKSKKKDILLTAPPGLKPAVEWVKAQIPYHNFPMNYGASGGGYRPLDSLSIGAFVLQDGESRWLLNKQLQTIRNQEKMLSDELAALWLWDDTVNARPYHFKSAILLSPSGYTFHPGQSQPDKIVMRAFEKEKPVPKEMYLLVNLRSTGWHRYPSTNSIVQFAYGNVAILVEGLASKKHHWLPAGRSTHRDKKIDRSRLNALVVERTGLDAWIGAISGVYSQWRQDVPRYADVSLWEKSGDIQIAQVKMTGWNGLIHYRTYFMDRDKFFGVVDIASDNQNRKKAVHWYLSEHAHNILEKSSNIKSQNGWDVKFTVPRNGAVNKSQWEKNLPLASKNAASGLKFKQKSDEQSFFSGAVFSFNGNLDFIDIKKSSQDHINGSIILTYSTQGKEKKIIVALGKEWIHEGIRSDARVVYLEKKEDQKILTYFKTNHISQTQNKDNTFNFPEKKTGQLIF